MTSSALRPLSLAEVLDGAFSLYRRRFALFFGLAALPMAAAVLLFVPLLAMPWLQLSMAGSPAPAAPSDGVIAAVITVMALLGLGTGALSLLSWGALVHAAAAVYRGGPVSAREALRHARGRLPTLLGGALAVVAAWIVAGAIVVGVGSTAPATLLLILPIGFVLAVALMVTGAVWLPVAVLEPVGPLAAFRRAGDLTDGAWGRATGTVVVLWIIAGAVGSAVQAGIFVLALVIGGVAAAAGAGAGAGEEALAAGMGGALVLVQLLSMVGSVLGVPVVAIGLTLHYLDRRVRTEALDLVDATPATPVVPA